MSKRKSRKGLLLIVAVAGLCIISAAALLMVKRSNRINEQQQMLLGRWVRPDGGYIIHIVDIASDGKLEAKYYNPRPIHVEQAEVTQTRRVRNCSLNSEIPDIPVPRMI